MIEDNNSSESIIFCRASDSYPAQPYLLLAPNLKNVIFIWKMRWSYYYRSVDEKLRKLGALWVAARVVSPPDSTPKCCCDSGCCQYADMGVMLVCKVL